MRFQSSRTAHSADQRPVFGRAEPGPLVFPPLQQLWLRTFGEDFTPHAISIAPAVYATWSSLDSKFRPYRAIGLGWTSARLTDDRYDDDYDWDSSFFYFDVAAGLYYRFSENIAFRGELGALRSQGQPVFLLLIGRPAARAAEVEYASAAARRPVMQKSSTTRLYLVRHGATQLTAEDRFAGAVGVDLSDEGRGRWRGWPSGWRTSAIEAVYCSPLSRTRRDRRDPGGAARPAALHRDGLREISHGRWEGLTRARGRGALRRRVRGLGGGPVHVRARGRRVRRGRAGARAARDPRDRASRTRARACWWSRTRRRCG